MTSYPAFLEGKQVSAPAVGFSVRPESINPKLFEFQRALVGWALRRGRAALFCDCGMGKTPMQLEWSRHAIDETGAPGLIAAPLAVAQQTAAMGSLFDVPVTICRTQADVRAGVNITNYEMLSHFDASAFGSVVVDESSILKSYSGKVRTEITEMFARTPYRLACSATPAPNDYMELGNHAEFMGIMKRNEMLSQFFVHDGGDTSKYRLMGHAESKFWQWLCSWAVMMRKPSDLGYSDAGYQLPPLHFHEHVVEKKGEASTTLFHVDAQTLLERRQARRQSLAERAEAAAALANSIGEPFLVWCDLNDEGDALEKLIGGSVQVAGCDTPEFKEKAMADFVAGRVRVLISKPSICGFGMNFQHCANVIFVGLSDSYEQFYQASRRCWRFGQKSDVHLHIVRAETEGAVVANIRRKEADADRMAKEMVAHMADVTDLNIKATQRQTNTYLRATERGDGWTAHLGDCVEVVGEMESESIGYSIFSPPFASLYTYSNSDRDMGNSADLEEFYEHFKYLVRDLYRVLMSGRLVSIHCFDIPAMKERDGYIGLIDFPAVLRQIFEDAGFIYHSKVTIWKDPVTAMQRTKALGLLHKTIRKDSSMSRQGIADYLITMRKPGANPEPIAHTHDEFPVSLWQRYASPVWMDINPSRTLQRESAREEKDERHICPLQLEVIERALQLWSNPGDLVLSPFMGIGSEGFCALKMKRRFVGAELKQSYFEQATRNLAAAEVQRDQVRMFDEELEAATP